MRADHHSALLPLALAVREEDEGTWMLTFSDLVLLLLAFVALGILMERSRGPHVVTDRLRASAPSPVGPARDEPFALVEGIPPAADEAPALEAARLRDLARRLQTRIAAEGIPGLRPVVVDATGITIELRAVARASAAIPTRLAIVPEPPTIVGDRPVLEASSIRERALARTARLAHELIAGDPLLMVHAVTSRDGESTPSRVKIARADRG